MQNALEVFCNPVGRARTPEVAQRIDSGNGNAALGERRRHLFIEPRPTSIAGKQHREFVACSRRRHFDDRQTLERARRSRDILRRRRGDRAEGCVELRGPCLYVAVVMVDPGKLYEARTLNLRGELFRLGR